MFVFIVLPFGVLLHLACSYFLINRLLSPSGGSRETILWILIQNGILCWFYAEAASVFDLIGYTSARFFWVGILALEVIFTLLFFKRPIRSIVREAAEYAKRKLFREKRVSLIIGAAAFLIIPLFFLAAFVPPNNFDSNNYHLHRIIAWLHYSNLGHYATPYLQQLYLNVFAEYAVLNVYLVTGSDQFVNLVQFFAGIGCLIGVTLLAKELGIGRFGQALSAFILLTVPSFVFELTTTQVELVATCYFLSFLYFGYRLRAQFSWPFLVAAGLSLALSVFSKYPAALYAIPFCVFFGASFLLKHGLKRSGAILIVMLASVLIIFSAFWSRNHALFGNVMNPKEGSQFVGEKLTADRYSPVLSLSNLIKNSSLHWGLPHTGFNKSVENGISKVHSKLGVDVNEPAISRDVFDVRYTVHEDMIPNTVHFLAIVFFSVLLCFRRNSQMIWVFWLLALSGFLLFCSALKFQHWSTRTHLPFFVMSAVMIGYCLTMFPAFLRNLLLTLFFVPALFFVVGNPAKPVVPVGYFVKKLAAHVPVYLCIDPGKKASYENLLSEEYDFNSEGAENCYPLRTHLPYEQRKEVFNELDQLGYFTPLSQTVFNTGRTELYFMNDPEKYVSFRKLIPEIKGENPGVGVMGRMNDGFYFYQAALRDSTGVEADFEYIYTSETFSSLENAQKPHCYSYIVTDDLELVARYFTEDQISRVVTGEGSLSLVCLKDENCKRFTF